MEKLKILVTGGAGFLGSNLCKKLLEDSNNYIYCLDNLYTGSVNNIKELQNNDRFEFIKGDIRSFDINSIKVDRIYNAACPASPKAYQKTPIDTLETCFIGTQNLLEMAKLNDAKIMQFSTSEIYGNALVHPQTEEYLGNVNSIGIRACYDEGKRVAETLCFEYLRQNGVKIKVVRIFNTYGPNMNKDDGRVVTNFITQAIRNEDITIYGNGNQTRSFCYVDDLIDGLIKFMESDDKITGPINLGNPTEFTIEEVARLIINKTHSKSKMILKDLPQDDPIKRKPDITKAKLMLNWEPKINFDIGIGKTIEYLKNNMG